MLIGVPRELLDSENRVAATPKTVQQILKLGFDVIVEHDAGFKASFEDQAFIDAGAKIGSSSEVWHSDVIFKVNPPTDAGRCNTCELHLARTKSGFNEKTHVEKN